MAISSVLEVLPPSLDSTSEPPPLFVDGNTRLHCICMICCWALVIAARLYICYMCPYAQRPWITRNCKGLQEKIKLVAIDLQNRPTWYKEKVYSENKVPSLEHNGKVIGESLDLIKYIDDNFEGPRLLPNDVEKQKFGEELMGYSDSFVRSEYGSFKAEDPVKEAGAGFDYLEKALQKFDDGPFFLGQTISLVDITYAPFVERLKGFIGHQWRYDVTSGRPALAAWIEEINKIDAYTQTKCDINKTIQYYKIRFMGEEN